MPLQFIRHSYLFVDFFFVLSGFVIAHAYGDRLKSPLEVWQFIVRRFGRVWPLHIAVLAAFIAVAVFKYAPDCRIGNVGVDIGLRRRRLNTACLVAGAGSALASR